MEHLQKITFLRESIRWRAYGQKDPLTEYKKEAFNYFLIMLARIRHRVVYFVLRSKIILLSCGAIRKFMKCLSIKKKNFSFLLRNLRRESFFLILLTGY